ncbi:D-aminoacyl-tRNA deacylase [Suilimivivens sp.]|uniref:D-aminoacyl-tRNA deacylase n=1 Tax=Suilimivivens sp. TaxID=2981669 RepID=UPI0030781E59
MKLVIQRVQEASVSVDQEVVGKIGHGFMVLLGVSQTDTEEIAEKMFQKLLKLRIFEDENGKTNLDIKSVNGELLIISQFTLYADCRHGNRPSFIGAGTPDQANALYEYFLSQCRKEIPVVEQGIFGAHMMVSLINDGPFTIVLDSNEIIK